MKTTCKILSCFVLALLLMAPGIAAATQYVNLAPGTEKWFTPVGSGHVAPYTMHTVVSTYPGSLLKMHREILNGSQVIASEDLLFDFNAEGDIYYYGDLRTPLLESPILWVDAPLAVGKTWRGSRPINPEFGDTSDMVHYVFAVLEVAEIACPAGLFKCHRVFLTEIYPNGEVECSCFWYNEGCGMIQCSLQDQGLFKLVKTIPGPDIYDSGYEIHNSSQAEELVGGIIGAPNPANPMTRIAFDLKEPAEVEISVFDISGRLVKRLVQGEYMSAGPVSIRWQGADDQGRTVASGTYLVQVKTGQTVSTKRITLVR